MTGDAIEAVLESESLSFSSAAARGWWPTSEADRQNIQQKENRIPREIRSGFPKLYDIPRLPHSQLRWAHFMFERTQPLVSYWGRPEIKAENQN